MTKLVLCLVQLCVLCNYRGVQQGRWAWVCTAVWRWRVPGSNGWTDCVSSSHAELKSKCEQKGYPAYFFCLGFSHLCILELLFWKLIFSLPWDHLIWLIENSDACGRLSHSSGCICFQIEIRVQGIFLAHLFYHFAERSLTICCSSTMTECGS